MLVIRLARTGKKKQAYFRIVVAEKQRAVGAKFIEILGNYNPHAKELKIDQDRLAEYLKNGAQPSNTLAKILKKEGIKLPSWVNIAERNRPAKKTEEPEEKKETPVAEEKETAEVDVQATEEKAETPEETKAEPVVEEAEVPAEPAQAEDHSNEEPKKEETKEEEVKEKEGDKE